MFEQLTPPDIRTKSMWRITAIIASIVWAAILAGASYFWHLIPFDISPLVLWIVGIPVMLWLVIMDAIVLPDLRYRFESYAVHKDGFEIRDGVFYKTRTFIPFVRIQHVEASQGPLEQVYGLYSLNIASASHSFSFTGLTKERAEDLTEQLMKTARMARGDL